MTAPAFDLDANQHLFFLAHAEEDLFQIRTNTTVATRWRLLSSLPYDIDRSTAAQFYHYSENQTAALKLRKLAAPFKRGSSTDSSLWYSTECLQEVLAALQAHSPAAVVPLRVIVPKDPVERADQEEDEKSYHEVRLELKNEEARKLALQRKQEWERADAERERRSEAEREKRMHAAAEALSVRIDNGEYLSPSHMPAKLLAQLTSLLQQLNIVCNGYCELRRRPKTQEFELNFYVRDELSTDLAKIVTQLRHVVVLNQDVGGADNSLRLSYPFRAPQRAFPPSKSRTVSHQSIAVDVKFSYFHDLLLELQPGIRGWDLPVNEPVLGYSSPSMAKLGSSTPPVACPARKAWTDGRPCTHPAIADYLRKFGITLGWDPAGIRHVAASPFAQDSGAPLMLLRLVRGTEVVGIQKIRLDTAERETLPFNGCSATNAVGALWAPKPHVFVATCLEDVMAMQSVVRKPCIVAPSPAALAEMEWPAGLTCVTALLPAKDPEPWMAAVAALKARPDVPHGGINIAQIFPHDLSDCPGLPYPAEWAWQCMQNEIKVAYGRRK